MNRKGGTVKKKHQSLEVHEFSNAQRINWSCGTIYKRVRNNVRPVPFVYVSFTREVTGPWRSDMLTYIHGMYMTARGWIICPKYLLPEGKPFTDLLVYK